MFDDYDTDELEDEITVEEVVLRSLNKVEGEKVEEEKRELREKIDGMKNLLEMRRSGQIDQTLPEHQREETTPTRLTTSGHHLKHGNGVPYPALRTPTHTHRATASEMANEISPTYNLPGRKRAGSTATPEAASRPGKTQKLTPTRETQPFEPVSHHSTASTWSTGSKTDPIDLTGLNGGGHVADATAVIGRIKAESDTRSLESPAKSKWNGAPASSGSRGDLWKNTIKPETGIKFSRVAAAPDGEHQQVKKEPVPPSPAPLSYFHPSNALVPPKRELEGSSRMPGSWEDHWERDRNSRHTSQNIITGPKVDTLQEIINRTSAFSQPGQSFSDVMNQSSDPNLPLSAPFARAASALDIVGNSIEKDEDIEKLLKHIQAGMTPEDRKLAQSPEGLVPALYPHQTFALAWMRKMENGTNKGGILADDMGLGKTISTISLMLANYSKSNQRKTNLIVGPLSLIHQWNEELSTKIRGPHKSIFIYHNKKAAVDDLLKYEFVLTTYGTLASEWKRLEKFKEDNMDRSIDWGDSGNHQKFPLLHPKAEWYRVVLDEAQCIKNRTTKAAVSAYALKSKFRWCLTGTPMMNGVHELFSLLRFLRIKPYCNWPDFLQRFGRLFGKNGSPKSQAMEALQTVLTATTLRRSKKTKLNGQPIIVLPEKTEKQIHVELSKDELDYYKQLEEKAQVQFNRYLRDGSVGKHYAVILVQLLRMRQACCHPHLNLDVDDPVSTNPHMEEVVKNLAPDVVARIKALDAFDCMICFDVVQEPSFYAPCGHYGCNNCLINAISEAQKRDVQAGEVDDEGNSKHGSRCPLCKGAVDMSNAFTYTAFQTVHMPEKLKEANEEQKKVLGQDHDTDSSDDSDGGVLDFLAEDADELGNLRGFVVADDIDTESDEESKAEQRIKAAEHMKRQQARLDQKRAEKAQKKLERVPMTDIKPSMLRELRKQSLKSHKAQKRYFDYLSHTWQPSAKVNRCVELLQEIDATGEKTIVFSQWTLLLDLIQVAMKNAGLNRPQRYDGSLKADQRSAAIADFRVSSGVKVMLVSLKAGNAGLNLTTASRVIILDPFWNPYIEMQAIDRTYRIGQTKEVQVYRILTESTVEDRIVALQERKKEMIESALDENRALMISKLRPQELKGLLFGR